ncbi:MAG: CBS domain-containing protein [Anaerolineae bacterium]|nr:CBS domain-containing protein [Anaerolineae bacterium]
MATATVKDLLDAKGSSVWTVTPDQTIREALKVMAEKHIGALPVMEDDKVAGIFSERDFARHAVEFSDCLNMEISVRELMSSPVYFVNLDQSVDECMAVMTAKKLRHLPVLQEGKLIGLISIGDVVKHQLAEKQSTIETLEHFLWVNLI